MTTHKLDRRLAPLWVLRLTSSEAFLLISIAAFVLVQAAGGMPVFAELFADKLFVVLHDAGTPEAKAWATRIAMIFGFLAMLLIEAISFTLERQKDPVGKKVAIAVFLIAWGGYMTHIPFPEALRSLNIFGAGAGDYVIKVALTCGLSAIFTYAIYRYTSRLNTLESQNKLFKPFAEASDASVERLIERLKNNAQKIKVETSNESSQFNEELRRLISA